MRQPVSAQIQPAGLRLAMTVRPAQPIAPAQATADAPHAGVWAALARRSDRASYTPRAAVGVEEQPQHEDGRDYVVLRSPTGTYLRLSMIEHALWRQMDGTLSVAQLGTQAFLSHRQLLPVGDLVAALRRGGFLADPPGNVYRQLATALEGQGFEGWGQRLLAALRGRQWSLPGPAVDAFFDRLYRSGGWLLFTPPFALLFALVAFGGLVAFGVGLLAPGRGAPELALGGSLALGIVAFGAMLLLSFVLHECAHGLAVKHFGRQVRRGGVMFYYGLPAAFVDTSDIWPEPPRRRVAVSAAGPASDLFLGGLGALVAALLPASALAPFGWRLALACYAATLFNLNPLLELDGYYMLVDALRVPNLRRRALAYVRGPFWERLREPRPRSHDERLLAIYGLAASAYLLVAGLLALAFWQRQLRALVEPLWAGGVLGRLLVVGLFVLVVLPVVLGLLLAAWSALQWAVSWLLRHGYGRRTGLMAGVALAATALLALSAFRYPPDSGIVLVIATALWALAAFTLFQLRELYRGAALAQSIELQLLATLLACAAALARLLGAEPTGLPLGLEWLSIAALFAATLAALPAGSLDRAPRSEQALAIGLLVCAFPVAGGALLLARQLLPEATQAQLLLRVLPVYLGMLVLALATPMILSFRESRVAWGRALLWFGAAGQLASYLLDLDPDVGLQRARAADIAAAGVWCAAWIVHLAALRQLNFDRLVTPLATAPDERQRLLASFQTCYAGLYQALVAVYGRRRAQILDDRMDIAAATAGWAITLDRQHARPAAEVRALGLAEQGARYAEVLRFALRIVSELAGEPFALRAIQAAYDVLPWPERETADRYVFPSAPWARRLSQHFHSQRDARKRLLRGLDAFLALDDAALDALNAALVEQPLRAGEVLLRAGEVPGGLWIVDVGEVVAWRDGDIVSEHGRGTLIAAGVLREQLPCAATYRASIDSTLLFLPASALGPELRARLGTAARDSQQALRLLERIPLFADAPRHTLRQLVQRARRCRLPARHVVVRQGQASGTLYIIIQGQAAVFKEASDARPSLVARLGPQEFFGELEYLRGTPPLASVVAASELELLAIPHAALDELLTSADERLSTGLERIGTGRMRALRG
jgi:putative peptide zinc metalloprotease protein